MTMSVEHRSKFAILHWYGRLHMSETLSSGMINPKQSIRYMTEILPIKLYPIKQSIKERKNSAFCGKVSLP